jgi:phosphoribosylformylglycinamidine synthase
LGASLDLQSLAKSAGLNDDAVLLFSESNSRFVLEIAAAAQSELEALCRAADAPFTKLGDVTDTNRVQIRGTGGTLVIDSVLEELKQSWKQPLAWK